MKFSSPRIALHLRVGIVLFAILCFGWNGLGRELVLAGEQSIDPAPKLFSSRDDIPEPPVELLKLTSISASPKGKGWEVEFSGAAPKLPPGSVIDFSLWWRTYKLQEFRVTLSGTGKFREKRAFEEMTGFAQGVSLKAAINFLGQSRSVKEAMEKDPVTFNLERNPWTVRFQKQSFGLGTEQQLEGQSLEAQNVFRDSLKTALRVEKLFSSKRSEAIGGTAFQSGGTFAPKEWQTFAEKEVRDPLRELQKTLRDTENSLLMLPYKRDFGYLTDIVNAVSLRSFERSRSLYGKLGIKPDSSDFSPRDINVSCQSSKSTFLTKRTKQLCKSQKIELSEIGG